jgi:hypothetical protein
MKRPTPREREYWEALGRFVEGYAELEQAMSGLLWNLTKISTPIARAVFSGVRAEAASQYINRIFEATKVEPPWRAAFQEVCSRLGPITEARNLIIHHETRRKRRSGDAVVTNKRVALNQKRLRERPMSATILDEMTADLDKIVAHLVILLWFSDGAPAGEIKFMRRVVYAEELASLWRYKPPQRPQPTAKKRRSVDRRKAQAPSIPPPASDR